MASITTSAPGATYPAAPGIRVAPGARRGWARAGIAAGVVGLAAFVASTGGLAVTEEALADNALLVEEIAGKGAYIWAFQALMSAAAVGLVLFGAGLRRRLDEQEPVGSLTGTVALLGIGLTAALCLVGGGISTELFWELQAANEDITQVDPDTIAANLGIYNTMGWVWAGVGLAAGAVAVAGLKHASVGRKLAWFSATMAGLIGLLQLIPLQYLAALPAALWCLVVGVAMSRQADGE
jgi:hypothetical protein